MIALLAAALLVAEASGDQAGWSDWQPFFRGQNGFGDTTYLYDGSSRRRRGDIVSVWVSYDFHYSGRNPTTHIELWEIDCGRSRSRSRPGVVLDGPTLSRPRSQARGFVAILAASAEAALSRQVCDRP